MTQSVTKYSDFRSSGFNWLGEVPSHWKPISLRAITTPRVEKNRADLPLLSVYRDYGVILRDSRDDNHNPQGADLTTCKIVHVGDLVLNKMKTWQGSLGVSAYHGIVSPAYIVLRLRAEELCLPYINYLLRSKPYITYYNQVSFGVRVNQWDMRYEDFKQTPIFLPPLEEQQKIVNFIQQQDRRIRRLIMNKKRLIELLEEQKQNIVNDGVTRTIVSERTIKSADDASASKIPDGWELLPIRRCARKVQTGGTPKGADEHHFSERGFNWFTPSDFGVDLYLSNAARQLSEIGKENVTIFPPNTVMMIGIGATIGKVSISKDTASCNQQINAIIPSEKIDPRFLALALRRLKQFILQTGNFTTMPIINQQQTKSLRIPVPPLHEQIRIVEQVERDSYLLNEAVVRANREILLIKEYRDCQIADLVTGKIDLRSFKIEDEKDLPDDDLIEIVGDGSDESIKDDSDGLLEEASHAN